MVRFTVDMFRNIEMDIHRFLINENLSKDFNVKQMLFEVVSKFTTDPKLMVGIKSDEELQLKVHAMMKRAVLSTLNVTIRDKFPPSQETCKVFILDSMNAAVNQNWNTTFALEEDVETSNMNLECIIIKSKTTTPGPHIHLQSKQMSRPNDIGIDNYHDTLLLTRMIKCEDALYCHYQPIKKCNVDSNIKQVFSKLDFNVLDHNLRLIPFKTRLTNVGLRVDNNTVWVTVQPPDLETFKHLPFGIDGSKITLYDEHDKAHFARVKSVDAESAGVELTLDHPRASLDVKLKDEVSVNMREYYMYFTYD